MERHWTRRRDGPAAQPRCFPQSRSQQNAQLFNCGSMYRLDTRQVLIMHLAPTRESAEIKRGVVLSLLRMGGKRVESHLATSAPSPATQWQQLLLPTQHKTKRADNSSLHSGEHKSLHKHWSTSLKVGLQLYFYACINSGEVRTTNLLSYNWSLFDFTWFSPP